MAKIDGPRYTGSLSVDLTSVADLLIDVPPGGLKGARAEQEGIDGVKKELAASIPAHGEAANIPPQVYQRFLTRTANLALLREKELELKKALEVVMETRVTTENDREDDISIMARAAQSAADRQKNPGIAAPFELTITYNGQIAEKGLQTRRKNAEAQASPPPASPPAAGEPKPPPRGE